MKHYFLAILLFFAGVCVAAEYGAAPTAPLVSDDGQIVYIAGECGTDFDTCRAVYSLSANGESSELLPSSTSFLDAKFHYKNYYLTASADFSHIWSTSLDKTPSAYLLQFNNCNNRKTQNFYESTVVSSEADWFMTNSDGTTMMRYGANDKNVKIYSVKADETITETRTIDGTTLKDVIFDLMPALSGNGEYLFYIGVDAGTGLKQLSLYQLELSSGSCVKIDDLGQAEVLDSLVNGVWQSTVKYVAANQDGSVVAYRWNGDAKGAKIRVATRCANGTYKIVGNISGDAASTANCYWPAISSSGRYIAFSCDGKAYRYDRTTATMMTVSDEGDNAGALAISRNGRYVAYVAGDNQTATVKKHDCGVALIASSAQLVFDRQKIVIAQPLPVEIIGTVSDNATLRFDSDDLESGDKLYYIDADGNEQTLENGKLYALSTAPLRWYFKPSDGDSSELRTISITLIDGEINSSVDVQIALRGDVVNLTAGMDGANSYSDMDFNADGTTAIVRSDGILTPNDTNSAFDLYAVNGINATAKYQRLTNGGRGDAQLFGGKISGNGNYAFYFRLDGTLCRYDLASGETTTLLESTDRYRTIAVSYDGTVIAIVKDGMIQLSVDAGESFSAVSSIDDDNSPFLSYDGRIVSFVSGGKLIQCHVYRGVSETVLSDVAQLSDVSHGGTRLLVRTKTNELRYHVLGENTFFALGAESNECTVPDGTCLPTKYTAKLSANGRNVFLLCSTGLYKREYKSAAWQQLFTDDAIKANSDFAVSSGGRYLLFPSTLKTLDPIAQSADGESHLMLWRNPDWSNSAARIDVTSYDTTEDKQYTINNLHFSSDSDGDDVVPIIVSAPSHGSLTVEDPTKTHGKYRLVYQPNENFCGTDSFELKLWDGSVFSETKTLTLNVKNVNDEPQWVEDECTTSIDVNAGENASAQVRASDPDTENPEEYRDTLTYSVVGDAPQWLTIDANAGDITVTLPMNVVSGEYIVTLGCTDGHIDTPITRQLTITVNPPTEQKFTLAYLFGRDSAKTSDDDTSASAQWRAALFGCWSQLQAANSKEYKILSLPGDIKVAELVTLFDGNSPWLWDNHAFRIANADETIPAGTGFWIKPTLSDNADECTITIMPVMSRDASFTEDAFLLLGPLVNEDAPASMQQYRFDGNAWHHTNSGWKLGSGIFLRK